MLTRSLVQQTRKRTAEVLDHLGIRLTPQERENIEVVEPGLGELERTG